jgi:hypothetical protein
MHVATDEGSNDIEIVGVYMPSTGCVKKAEHEVSLLFDGVFEVIVHVNVCEYVECHFRDFRRIVKSSC